MNLHRILPLLAAVLLLGACAGRPVRATAPPASASVAVEQPATAQETAPAASVPEAPQASANAEAATASPAPEQAAAADTTTAAAPTDAEDDFAALYGGPTADAGAGNGAAPAYDPWEKYNRRMHRFNLAVDRGVARPLATAYVHVVPRVARTGVSNFFSTLRSPLTMVNQLLQGHADDAWDTLGRFLMNSTLGIGGLFDPASKAMVPRRSEDFGQTLGTWGWRQSRYVELPFFGPRTVRDVFGLAGDTPLSPLRRIEMDKLRLGLQGLQLVDTRVQLLSLDDIRDSAVDEYALTRDAWLQRRNYQIEKDLRRGHRGHENDEQTTIPVDAMPMPDWGR